MDERYEYMPDWEEGDKIPSADDALAQLFAQGYCCYASGDLLCEHEIEVDHVNPWKPLTKENMFFLSDNVRHMRGNMTFDTFLAFITKILVYSDGIHQFKNINDLTTYQENLDLLFEERQHDEKDGETDDTPRGED